MKWQHGGHDLLARTTAKEGPAWFTACNEHGDLHEAKTAKEAEPLGTLAQRPKWCTGRPQARREEGSGEEDGDQEGGARLKK